MVIYLAYTLVLVAMGLAGNVSYAVALRQLSILFGAILGILVLREPCPLPKLVGVAILLAGLILVGTG